MSGLDFMGISFKYSTAFFSCNGAIFLFDLSTFTDNISRQRCLCPNNFPFFSLLDIESLCFHYQFLCRYTLGVFWLQFYCCLLFVCVCVCVCVWGRRLDPAHTFHSFNYSNDSMAAPLRTHRNNGQLKTGMCRITSQSANIISVMAAHGQRVRCLANSSSIRIGIVSRLTARWERGEGEGRGEVLSVPPPHSSRDGQKI